MIDANILIVEDESIVAKDIETRLKKFGYHVFGPVPTGEEAIKKVTEKSPDLVLMDIRLKGKMDGVETAQLIHQNFDIPVIYITANADEKTLERAKVTDPFGYIIKPFKEKDLKTTIEITLNKYQMERKLKQSEQWLATVLKSIGDAVITSDAIGTITFMNPVAEELTGWKQQDAFGKEATEIFNITHADTQILTEHPIAQVLRQGVTVELPEQTLLISKNGVQIPIDGTAAPIKDDKGNIMGAVLVFRDITERQHVQAMQQKQIEQEQLIAQLEKLSELKDDFLSTVSHELRTPIANMKMAIQMLKISPTAEKTERYLEILQAECNREKELIDDLLDLQKLDSSSYRLLLRETLNLKEWLPSVIEPFQVRTQQNQQILQINLANDLPLLVTDRPSVERVVAELLNNACKYTPAGCEIVLSVSHQNWGVITGESELRSREKVGIAGGDAREEQPLVPLTFNYLPLSPHSCTTFKISNQAEISAVELPRIFDKFYRVASADRWKQSGTGLGLALVKKLVEHLQGTISVNSREGWTTFVVQLPHGNAAIE